MNIEVVRGDLLNQPDLDVIVNAANTHMWHGGGIAGAISRAAGTELDRESRDQRPVATGGAIWTTAGDLPYKAVVHAVGPIWEGGDKQEMELLRKAHLSALRRAVASVMDQPAVRVGFPAISCGIFHFPVKLAAPIAISAIRSVGDRLPIETVRFCLLDDEHIEAFEFALA